jgi:K+-transporting ATPase ATPase B chain
VIRESGGDRSAATGGTRVTSDWPKVKITAAQRSTFLSPRLASDRNFLLHSPVPIQAA